MIIKKRYRGFSGNNSAPSRSTDRPRGPQCSIYPSILSDDGRRGRGLGKLGWGAGGDSVDTSRTSPNLLRVFSSLVLKLFLNLSQNLTPNPKCLLNSPPRKRRRSRLRNKFWSR